MLILKNKKDPKSTNLLYNLRKQKKKLEQTTPKACRRKEVKIKAEEDEIASRKTVEENNETKSWFFEKINKVDKPLVCHVDCGKPQKRLKLLKS